jgi:hypothetical protein
MLQHSKGGRTARRRMMPVALITLAVAVLVPATATFAFVDLATPAKPRVPAAAVAPLVSTSFPANGGAYNSAGWTAHCGGTTGVCGSASDAYGVGSVYVAVQQVSTGRYWNGASYGARTSVLLRAAGTTSWKLPLPLPPDGSYRVTGKAISKLGAATPVTALAQTTIDNTKPLPPILSAGAANQTSDTSAQFAFRSNDAAVGFVCSLDGATAAACASPAKYKNLDVGAHSFRVYALDAARNTSAPASYAWTIARPASFRITGNIAGLAPGVTQPVDLTFTNANDVPISVTAVTITIGATTTKNGEPNPGCSGTQNLVVVHSFTGPVTVPANTTESLTDLSVAPARWPSLQMPDLPVNQDACKDTSFALTYSGAAAQA